MSNVKALANPVLIDVLMDLRVDAALDLAQFHRFSMRRGQWLT
jgi:hypothetical protein